MLCDVFNVVECWQCSTFVYVIDCSQPLTEGKGRLECKRGFETRDMRTFQGGVVWWQCAEECGSSGRRLADSYGICSTDMITPGP